MEWMIGFAPFLMVMFIVWTISRSKLESKRLSVTAQDSAEKAAQYASNIQQLEDRVRVLERIVTDSGYHLTHEIDRLRDTKDAN